MDVSMRNLIAGFVGLVILLVSVLAYAQINGSQNFQLEEYELPAK